MSAKVETFFWSGFTSAAQDGALISLSNKSTDRRKTIRLEYYDIKPWAPGTANFSQVDQDKIGPYAVYKTTAATSDGPAIILHPLNASSPSLPSQVLCNIQSAVTIDSTKCFSNVFIIPLGAGPSSSASSYALVSQAGVANSPFSNRLGRWGVLDGSTQGLIMREGTGIAIVPSTLTTVPTSTPANGTNFLLVTVRDETNNRTYCATCDFTSSGAQELASFSIFNGVGSGITLSVLSINYCYSGTAYNGTVVPHSVRFIRTRGDSGAGELMQATAANPHKSSPSWVNLSRGRMGYHNLPKFDSSGFSETTNIDNTTNPFNEQPVASQFVNPSTFPGYSAIFSIGTYRRMIPYFPHRIPLSTEQNFSITAAPSFISHGSVAKNNDQFVIPPGSGLALVQCNSTFYNAYWVDLAFSVYADSTPTARAFSSST